MNRLIFYRNIALFFIFVTLFFTAPFLFAATETGSFIQVNEANMNFYGYKQKHSTPYSIGKESVLQIPQFLITHDGSGQIDLKATLVRWNEFGEGNPSMGPRTHNGQRYYPVKIRKHNHQGLSDGDVGYVNLEQMLGTDGYKTRKLINQVTAPEPAEIDPREEPISSNKDFGEEAILVEDAKDSSEVTTAAPKESLRPNARPNSSTFGPQTTTDTVDAAARAKIHCAQTEFLASGYQNNNCLAKRGMDLVERAMFVMKDLVAINNLRAPKSYIDPRFSICIASKESDISPSAGNSVSSAKSMFQVLDNTGPSAIQQFGVVTPGLKHLGAASKYQQFVGKMLTSTLAQADLHHATTLLKFKEARGSKKENVRETKLMEKHYPMIARRYFHNTKGGPYSDKVMSCYNDIKKYVTANGEMTGTKAQVKAALLKVK